MYFLILYSDFSLLVSTFSNIFARIMAATATACSCNLTARSCLGRPTLRTYLSVADPGQKIVNSQSRSSQPISKTGKGESRSSPQSLPQALPQLPLQVLQHTITLRLVKIFTTILTEFAKIYKIFVNKQPFQV